MHLLSLVADRLWLIKDGAVMPYEDDLEAYRKMLLTSNKPEAKSKAGGKKDKPRPSRDQILGLRGEVRTCEARVTKLNEMRDKLAKKLGDPAMYQPEKIVESEVWQKKYSEVMTALERAETLWMTALEKLDKAENQA
jgi:ATP-binding cassette subfamily F protein 3